MAFKIATLSTVALTWVVRKDVASRNVTSPRIAPFRDHCVTTACVWLAAQHYLEYKRMQRVEASAPMATQTARIATYTLGSARHAKRTKSVRKTTNIRARQCRCILQYAYLFATSRLVGAKRAPGTRSATDFGARRYQCQSATPIVACAGEKCVRVTAETVPLAAAVLPTAPTLAEVASTATLIPQGDSLGGARRTGALASTELGLRLSNAELTALNIVNRAIMVTFLKAGYARLRADISTLQCTEEQAIV